MGYCYTLSLPVREGPDQLLNSQEDPEGVMLLNSLSTCEGGTRPAPVQSGGPRRWDVATLPGGILRPLYLGGRDQTSS